MIKLLFMVKTKVNNGGTLSDITFNNNVSKFQEYMHFMSLNSSRMVFKIKKKPNG